MTTLKTMKDFDKEFSKTKFAKNGGSCFECCDYEEMYDELKQFFNSKLEKILEDVMKCVPEKDKTENILEEHSFARFGYIIGFNSCREQMIKNLKGLLK